MSEYLTPSSENPVLVRDPSLTSVMYYGGTNIGDRHWVGRMVFPDYEPYRHYSQRRVLTFRADASIVYSGPGPGAHDDVSEDWGVMLEDPQDNEPHYFKVGISPNQTREKRYPALVGVLEARLGRTGLHLLLY